jgi:hypothetical protein
MAGKCPFRLGRDDLIPSQRHRQLSDVRQFVGHIKGHLSSISYPFKCQHPCCDLECDSLADLLNHFEDDHTISLRLEEDTEKDDNAECSLSTTLQASQSST